MWGVELEGSKHNVRRGRFPGPRSPAVEAQGDLPKRSPSALYTFPLGFTFLFLFKLGFEPVQKTQFYTS